MKGDSHILLKPSLSALGNLDSCGRQRTNLACKASKLVLELSTVRSLERTLSIVVIKNIQIGSVNVGREKLVLKVSLRCLAE